MPSNCISIYCKSRLLMLVAALAAAASTGLSQTDNGKEKVAMGKGPIVAAVADKSPHKLAFWMESTLNRVFPQSPEGTSTSIELLSGRNMKLSFQACVRNRSIHAQDVECVVTAPDAIKVRVRRVGYVPLKHLTTDTDPSELDGAGLLPGLVPDPLFPEPRASVGPSENQSFWVSVFVPADAKPGKHDLKVTMKFGDKGSRSVDLTALINVKELVIKPRQSFPVTHWWHADAIYHSIKAPRFDEKWWAIMPKYVSNMVDHGSNVVYVPLFHNRREVVPQPCQLLKITTTSQEQYQFDFSDVSRFVKLAKDNGAEYLEWTHLWIYWGVRNPIRIFGNGPEGRSELLWSTEAPATTGPYLTFLKQFLPAFHEFLKKEGVLEKSYFHLSDEPGGDEHFANYRKARELLRELAPWMKVMDALSEVRYGKEGLTDYPVPIISSAPAYIDAKIPHWVYYCCGPRGKYLNRFMDTPLPKIRMSGWLFYRLGASGFLHWGYTYWYKMDTQELTDPFSEGSGYGWPGIPYGDPFVVYPSPDGPLDSIRWEVFAESLQDYALLQSAEIKPDDPLLEPLKDYANFPRSEEWIRDAVTRCLGK